VEDQQGGRARQTPQPRPASSQEQLGQFSLFRWQIRGRPLSHIFCLARGIRSSHFIPHPTSRWDDCTISLFCTVFCIPSGFFVLFTVLGDLFLSLVGARATRHCIVCRAKATRTKSKMEASLEIDLYRAKSIELTYVGCRLTSRRFVDRARPTEPRRSAKTPGSVDVRMPPCADREVSASLTGPRILDIRAFPHSSQSKALESGKGGKGGLSKLIQVVVGAC
jgi:hypothetical protein